MIVVRRLELARFLQGEPAVLQIREEIAELLARFDRERFIALRTALVTAGIADPVLMRFDSHTVVQADQETVKEQLRILADSFTG